MENLEDIKISYTFAKVDSQSTNYQIFPKSLKRLEIALDLGYVHSSETLSIYDTIDTSYTSLYSLTIVSNRMLQNLSLGMPNLKEVEIKDYGSLDQSKIIEFLKANPQLKNLSTYSVNYGEKIIKNALSSEYLERWNIDRGSWEGIEIDILPSNYSIKYLKIYSDIPGALTLKIINACKNLETLDINHRIFTGLDLINFEGRIKFLKLTNSSPTLKSINQIDISRVFNQVYIDFFSSIENLIGNNTDELKNYKFIPLTSQSCTLKLINKTD
ncbi:hypothetical protein CONCODRAFT_13619 [Conidiobolus coronatus NRRL 28638]|uniref:RNI-like protein n=1 Tax=Conidiobolus coronatus (strain ATCC 28846 / CBS 209.66 / NRRL 28638) TaxID=796925 RepID=A0A137NQD9_CONC2|nr:hypothetical protein CONCODRAFT_13619 [Conidiobolus coronatus NRRL 28638]|eukprot:KXN64967.1 hypothetical protein CONCODRAFT_13619 [Conidiobolus coronatus NRRL 28638]